MDKMSFIFMTSNANGFMPRGRPAPINTDVTKNVAPSGPAGLTRRPSYAQVAANSVMNPSSAKKSISGTPLYGPSIWTVLPGELTQSASMPEKQPWSPDNKMANTPDTSTPTTSTTGLGLDSVRDAFMSKENVIIGSSFKPIPAPSSDSVNRAAHDYNIMMPIPGLGSVPKTFPLMQQEFDTPRKTANQPRVFPGPEIQRTPLCSGMIADTVSPKPADGAFGNSASSNGGSSEQSRGADESSNTALTIITEPNHVHQSLSAASPHSPDKNSELSGEGADVFTQKRHPKCWDNMVLAGVVGMMEAWKGAHELVQSLNPDFFIMPHGTRVINIKIDKVEAVQLGIRKSLWSTLKQVSERITHIWNSRKNSSEKILFLFAVNGSKCFCGLAEMSGPWEPTNDVETWAISGCVGRIPLTWLFVKNVTFDAFAGVYQERNKHPIVNMWNGMSFDLDSGRKVVEVYVTAIHFSNVLSWDKNSFPLSRSQVGAINTPAHGGGRHFQNPRATRGGHGAVAVCNGSVRNVSTLQKGNWRQHQQQAVGKVLGEVVGSQSTPRSPAHGPMNYNAPAMPQALHSMTDNQPIVACVRKPDGSFTPLHGFLNGTMTPGIGNNATASKHGYYHNVPHHGSASGGMVYGHTNNYGTPGWFQPQVVDDYHNQAHAPPHVPLQNYEHQTPVSQRRQFQGHSREGLRGGQFHGLPSSKSSNTGRTTPMHGRPASVPFANAMNDVHSGKGHYDPFNAQNHLKHAASAAEFVPRSKQEDTRTRPIGSHQSGSHGQQNNQSREASSSVGVAVYDLPKDAVRGTATVGQPGPQTQERGKMAQSRAGISAPPPPKFNIRAISHPSVIKRTDCTAGVKAPYRAPTNQRVSQPFSDRIPTDHDSRGSNYASTHEKVEMWVQKTSKHDHVHSQEVEVAKSKQSKHDSLTEQAHFHEVMAQKFKIEAELSRMGYVDSGPSAERISRVPGYDEEDYLSQSLTHGSSQTEMTDQDASSAERYEISPVPDKNGTPLQLSHRGPLVAGTTHNGSPGRNASHDDAWSDTMAAIVDDLVDSPPPSACNKHHLSMVPAKTSLPIPARISAHAPNDSIDSIDGGIRLASFQFPSNSPARFNAGNGKEN